MNRNTERLACLTAMVLSIFIFCDSRVLAHSADTDIDTAATRCEGLASTDFSSIEQAPTQVIDAKIATQNDNRATYCEVRGYVWPQVGFLLQLPTVGWNGKFFELGCGGSCGDSFADSDDPPLTPTLKGYASIKSDMGHKGKGLDGLWANNNIQAQIDYGYRSAHVVALAGKAITEYYYGKPPVHSYFFGGSTGGRQALIEAQRFPWDFEGIIALSVWIDDTESAMDTLWAIRALQDERGSPVLTAEDLLLIHSAALEACDLDDGVKDGLISNPLLCHFEPRRILCTPERKLRCLSEVKVAAVQKVYNGPVNSKGARTYFAGAMPGSEMRWANVLFLTEEKTDDSSFPLNTIITVGKRSVMEDWVTEYFQYMVIPPLGRNWKITDFNFDTDYKRVGTTSESLLNAGNPDLRNFKAAGGKLIIVQGWEDPLASIPMRTIDYYETSERTMGGRKEMRDFSRLFLIPGMAHSPQHDWPTIDFISYLETWVEHGQAPDALIASRLTGANSRGARDPSSKRGVLFTRPIYPYPAWAKYKGTGDVNNAKNFEPMDTE